jgi:hypothetical protein
LNALHVESRVYSNVIPNSGVHVLSEQQIYDNKENVPGYINARFRNLIFRALDDYTRCYRIIPAQFQEESDNDLERIRDCYSD